MSPTPAFSKWVQVILSLTSSEGLQVIDEVTEKTETPLKSSVKTLKLLFKSPLKMDVHSSHDFY